MQNIIVILSNIIDDDENDMMITTMTMRQKDKLKHFFLNIVLYEECT